jgi:hypothetical protein
LCRESLQFFADYLVTRASDPDVDADPAHTVARVRSVIKQRKPDLSEGLQAFLDSLLNYWGCAQDLVQRQEHGGLKKGEALGWEDGRRVVFHTLIVMYEVDRVVAV